MGPMQNPIPRLRLPFVWLPFVALAGCDQAPTPAIEAAATATPVGVWIAESTGLTDARIWSGTLEPLRVHEIRLPAPGRVRQILVQEGDRVAAGAPLIRIQSPDAEARIPVLTDRVQRLTDEFERWRDLARSNAAGAGEVTAAELRLFEAREALAALEATQSALALSAPVGGQVVRVLLAPGREEGAGTLALVLEESASYGVRLRIPAAEANRFTNPAKLEVSLDSGQPLQVARVVAAPDPQPGFVQVELFLANTSAQREGVRVRSAPSAEGIVVPWTAVAADGTRSWVAIAVPSTTEDGSVRFLVERRTITLGGAHPDGVEAPSGLEPGDRIIRFEPRSHREGRWVEPRVLDSGQTGPNGDAS